MTVMYVSLPRKEEFGERRYNAFQACEMTQLPVLTPQFEGQAVPDISTWPTTISSEIDQLVVWSDFTLDQLAPDKFSIAKRTVAGGKAAWLSKAGFGDKSSGVGYVGGANGGGVTFAVRDF